MSLHTLQDLKSTCYTGGATCFQKAEFSARLTDNELVEGNMQELQESLKQAVCRNVIAEDSRNKCTEAETG
jgi:hypothetical protein